MPEETTTTAPEAAQADPTPETLIPAVDLLDGVGEFDVEEEAPAEPTAETPETEENPDGATGTEGDDVGATAGDGGGTDAEAVRDNGPAQPVAAGGDGAKPGLPPAGAGSDLAGGDAPVAQPPAIDPRLTAYENWKRDAAPLLAKLRAGELDPIDHADEFKKAHAAAATGYELLEARQDAIHEYQQAEQAWQSWAMTNPDVPMGRARQLFQQAVAETQAKYPDAGPQSVQRLATDGFNARVQAMRDAAKAPATTTPAAAPAAPVPPKPAPTGKPKPPVTKGGAMVQPRGTSSTRPPAPRKTAEDYLADNASGFKDLLG